MYVLLEGRASPDHPLIDLAADERFDGVTERVTDSSASVKRGSTALRQTEAPLPPEALWQNAVQD